MEVKVDKEEEQSAQRLCGVKLLEEERPELRKNTQMFSLFLEERLEKINKYKIYKKTFITKGFFVFDFCVFL